jgi:hypothetical protein
MARFSTSPHHDPTITQKVRTALYESGQGELVHEIVIDGMRDIEQMARGGLKDHSDRIKILEDAERARVTETGVWRIVKGKLDAEAVGWMRWATRAGLAALGSGALAGLAWLIRLAWKGAHS